MVPAVLDNQKINHNQFYKHVFPKNKIFGLREIQKQEFVLRWHIKKICYFKYET